MNQQFNIKRLIEQGMKSATAKMASAVRLFFFFFCAFVCLAVLEKTEVSRRIIVHTKPRRLVEAAAAVVAEEKMDGADNRSLEQEKSQEEHKDANVSISQGSSKESHHLHHEMNRADEGGRRIRSGEVGATRKRTRSEKESDVFSNFPRSATASLDLKYPDLLPVLTATGALNLPVMYPVEDMCEAGRSYVITSTADVEDVLNKGELWCLFSVGIVPDRPPLGFMSTHFLTFHTTQFWVPVGFNWFESVQGKFVVETECTNHHGTVFFAGAGISSFYPLWGLLQISQGGSGAEGQHQSLLGDEFVDGEFEDGRGGLVIDFRVNLKQLCADDSFLATHEASSPFPSSVFAPMASSSSSSSSASYTVFNPSLHMFGDSVGMSFENLPTSQHVDLARIVGRDSADGRLIYLVRSAMQDNNRPDRGLQTYMWSIWKSAFEDALDVPLPSETVLGPTQAFEYEQKGVFVNYYGRVLPYVPGY